MNTIIKRTLLICLSLLLLFTAGSCGEKEDNISYSLYDPREDEGYVKDGFSIKTYSGIIYSPSSNPYYIAYKCPDQISVASDSFDIELFYGYYAWSPHHGSKTLETQQLSHWSLYYGSEEEKVYLEDCIPYDDAKLYYILSEEKAVYDDPDNTDGEVKIHLHQLTYGHSKTYNIPTSVFKNDKGTLRFTFHGNKFTDLYGFASDIELGYVKEDGAVRIYTAAEYAEEFQQ